VKHIIFLIIKKTRNKVRKATRLLYKEEQTRVAKLAKSNPQKFWKYVKSKSKTNPGIGDLRITDKDGM